MYWFLHVVRNNAGNDTTASTLPLVILSQGFTSPVAQWRSQTNKSAVTVMNLNGKY
jgi:hypothetical protein